MQGKILFIDDQRDFLNLIQLKLSKEPYECFFITDPKEISKIMENHEIDVVVTDINMPSQNGIVLLKHMRENYPNVVRVAMSGIVQINNIISAINDGGIYKYITKPWKSDKDGKKIIEDALEYAKSLKD